MAVPTSPISAASGSTALEHTCIVVIYVESPLDTTLKRHNGPAAVHVTARFAYHEELPVGLLERIHTRSCPRHHLAATPPRALSTIDPKNMRQCRRRMPRTPPVPSHLVRPRGRRCFRPFPSSARRPTCSLGARPRLSASLVQILARVLPSPAAGPLTGPKRAGKGGGGGAEMVAGGPRRDDCGKHRGQSVGERRRPSAGLWRRARRARRE